jgi:cyclophilin family peptidyl-prolyl cis-trans isomerase
VSFGVPSLAPAAPVGPLTLTALLNTLPPPLTFGLDPASQTGLGDLRTTIDPITNPTGAVRLRAQSAANVTVTLVTQITTNAAGNMTTLHPDLSATTSGGIADFDVNLASGPNDFFMTATDAAGNTTVAEQVITRNDPPTVSTPIGDVNVPQNSPPTMIDLSTHFSDVDMVNSIARTDTSLGRIDVMLFDQTTPAGQKVPATTVANFLTYVNSGVYANTVVHRSVRVTDAGVDVIQGGGFALNNQGFLNTTHIPTNPAIPDEPGISNTRGTIAMAKSGPNTATSEWFINRTDNIALDNPAQPSGAFTVFGRVLGNGMNVVDAIAAVPTFNFSGSFSNIPLRNFSSADVSNFPQSATASKVVLTNWSLFRRRDVLTFSITGNDNPGLVTPSINGSQLTLTYTQNMTGTAHITVRATDLDGASVEDRFTVTVM